MSPMPPRPVFPSGASNSAKKPTSLPRYQSPEPVPPNESLPPRQLPMPQTSKQSRRQPSQISQAPVQPRLPSRELSAPIRKTMPVRRELTAQQQRASLPRKAAPEPQAGLQRKSLQQGLATRQLAPSPQSQLSRRLPSKQNALPSGPELSYAELSIQADQRRQEPIQEPSVSTPVPSKQSEENLIKPKRSLGVTLGFVGLLISIILGTMILIMNGNTSILTFMVIIIVVLAFIPLVMIYTRKKSIKLVDKVRDERQGWHVTPAFSNGETYSTLTELGIPTHKLLLQGGSTLAVVSSERGFEFWAVKPKDAPLFFIPWSDVKEIFAGLAPSSMRQMPAIVVVLRSGARISYIPFGDSFFALFTRQQALVDSQVEELKKMKNRRRR